MARRRTKVGKTFDNPAPEWEFRQALMARAKTLGCDGDLRQIFEKFDKALKGCTNEVERRHIQTVGAAEVHKLFGCRGGLVVNGWTIIPAEPGYEDPTGGKIIKI